MSCQWHGFQWLHLPHTRWKCLLNTPNSMQQNKSFCICWKIYLGKRTLRASLSPPFHFWFLCFLQRFFFSKITYNCLSISINFLLGNLVYFNRSPVLKTFVAWNENHLIPVHVQFFMKDHAIWQEHLTYRRKHYGYLLYKMSIWDEWSPKCSEAMSLRLPIEGIISNGI